MCLSGKRLRPWKIVATPRGAGRHREIDVRSATSTRLLLHTLPGRHSRAGRRLAHGGRNRRVLKPGITVVPSLSALQPGSRHRA